MTPQERQLVDDLFERLSKMESAPRDPDAVAAIAQGLRIAPNAIYPLVQTVLLQDEALRRANSRIQELEAAGGQQQEQAGGFLGSMREAIFGQNQPRGSVPSVRPPEAGNRPVWNSGQVMQQATSPGSYDQGPYGQPSYGQPPYGQSYGGPQSPFGGGGSFLGTAAATAAGVVGGSLLLNSIRSMMGGSRQGFGDAAAMTDRSAGASPWTNQSDSSLARDAGINDVGSSADRHDDNSRAGLFDTASTDDNDNDSDMDTDADDFDGGDFGGGGDSDFA
jgi:uncharacterized protein